MSALLGLLRLTVVVGAGVAAWFGYDAYVEAEDAEAAATEAAPWADLDLVVADAVWDGPVRATVLTADDSRRQVIDFAAERDRSILTEYDDAGEPAVVSQIDADEVFVRRVGEEWPPAAETPETGAEIRLSAASHLPVTVDDVIAPEVWPYTRVIGEREGGDADSPTRILTVRMKGGAFTNADPAGAAQWRANHDYPNVGGRVEVELEIDAGGQVVGLEFLALDGTRYEFEPLDAEPTFDAPFTT